MNTYTITHFLGRISNTMFGNIKSYNFCLREQFFKFTDQMCFSASHIKNLCIRLKAIILDKLFGNHFPATIIFISAVSIATVTIPRTDAGSEPGDMDAGVRTARDILVALTDTDPQTALRALKLRRELYEQERRDPGLLAILDKAIELLATTGSLDGLSSADQATLMAHTCTSGTDSDRGFRVR